MKLNFVQTYTAEHLVFVSLVYKTINNEEDCESQIKVVSGDIMPANLKYVPQNFSVRHSFKFSF